MSETVGFWCDHCRRKYLRHVCKPELPCRHSKKDSVFVYAKAFGRGGERVVMEFDGKEVDIWVNKIPDSRNTIYVGRMAYEVHGRMVEPSNSDAPISVAEWLRTLPEKVVRAYLDRWESCKEAPDWWGVLNPITTAAAGPAALP